MSTTKRVSGNYTIQSINPSDYIQLNSQTVIVSGNLIVTGNTQTINSTELAITNNSITLNNGALSPNPFGANIIVDRGTYPNVAISWNETMAAWTLTNDGATYHTIALDQVVSLMQETTVLTANTTVGSIAIRKGVTAPSPGLFTFPNHGFVQGTPVYFSVIAPDTAPAGLTVGQEYFVIAGGLSANTFEVATVPDGSQVATAIYTGSKLNVYPPVVAVSYDLLTVGDGITITVPPGDTYIVESTTLATLTGSTIILNNGVPTANPSGAEILVDRGNQANVAIMWSETAKQWQLTNDGANFYQISTILPPPPSLTIIATNLTVGNATIDVGATISIATPAVINFTNHGFGVGQQVIFSTTGALPTGLVAGQTYYVLPAGLTNNTFEVSSVIYGSAINTTGSQSGIHSVYPPTVALYFGTVTIINGATITVPVGDSFTVDSIADITDVDSTLSINGAVTVRATSTGAIVTGTLSTTGTLSVASDVGIAGALTVAAPITMGSYTIGTLPTPAIGMRSWVTNGATIPTPFTAVSTTGTSSVPVFYGNINGVAGWYYG